MKHWVSRYIAMICSCLFLLSCSEDELVKQTVVGEPVDVMLSFGATNHDQIEIK